MKRDERAERAHVARELEASIGGEFGSLFTDPVSGETVAYADLAPIAVGIQDETVKRLDRYSDRQRARWKIVGRLNAMDPMYRGHPYIERLRDKMVVARSSATMAVRLADGKRLIRWDVKTGNSRIDPDDAREEAARFSKRLLPQLLALQRAGARLTYACFTVPNVAPGDLRAGCKRTLRRLGGFLRRWRRGDYPQIGGKLLGAAAVLEAPLAASRDWNIHVNVILVHKGFADFGEIRRLWHWNVEFKPIRGGRQGIEDALREVIKYSVQAVSEKSAEKASRRTSHAPPLVEWTDAEIFEFLLGFRRLRRSRTYGALFRLPKPEKLNVAEFVNIGVIHWCPVGNAYRCRTPLLDSIPGDKSASIGDRVAEFFRLLRGRDRPASAAHGWAGG